MAIHHDFDGFEVLFRELYNPIKLGISCVGTVRSGRRCQNPVSAHNRETARVVLRGLSTVAHNEDVLRRDLDYVCGKILCRHHRWDQCRVTNDWYTIIRNELQRLAAFTPPASEDDLEHDLEDDENGSEVNEDDDYDGCDDDSVTLDLEVTTSGHDDDQRPHQRRFESAREEQNLARATVQSLPSGSETSTVEPPSQSPEVVLPKVDTVPVTKEEPEGPTSAQNSSEHECTSCRRVTISSTPRGDAPATTSSVPDIFVGRTLRERRLAIRESRIATREAAASGREERLNRRESAVSSREIRVEMRERTLVAREEREADIWRKVYGRYLDAWQSLAESDSDLKQLPWPVESGNSEDVREDTVEEFLQRCTETSDWGHDDKLVLKKLREEALRWCEQGLDNTLDGHDLDQADGERVKTVRNVIVRLKTDLMDKLSQGR